MTKPEKPTPDFPLYAHGSGQWAKSIGGKKVYFGTWDDPQEALKRYNERIGQMRSSGEHSPLESTENQPLQPTTKKAKGSKGHVTVPTHFPLTPHRNGQWCKKIRGKIHYFGSLRDPVAARSRYVQERADLEAGRTPDSRTQLPILADLIYQFLHAKRVLLTRGELAQVTYDEYEMEGKRLVKFFDAKKALASFSASDFDKYAESLPGKWSLVTFGNCVRRTRAIFRFASNSEVAPLVDRPIRFGLVFKQPSRTSLRKEQNSNPTKEFSAKEVQRLLAQSRPVMKAMILLGINCGFGTKDCGEIPLSALNLESGWVDYPRSKTAIRRRCPLWKETIEAIQAYLLIRPKPQPGQEGFLFLTKYGNNFYHKGSSTIGNKFRQVLDKCALHFPGRGFYSFRHVFQTVGESAGDAAPIVTSAIMGHAPASEDMAAVYRTMVTDERLSQVTEYVRHWLYGNPMSIETLRQDSPSSQQADDSHAA